MRGEPVHAALFHIYIYIYIPRIGNLIYVCRTKFHTSNRCKPVRVLTRTKCSCSDDRLPIGYLLLNFQLIWSSFLNHFSLTRQKGGRHERGFGLFLKELNMDSLNRRLESYCLQTTEAIAYWMSLMHLPPTLPSWARSEASIFFPTQNFKIRKGRRSCCEILRYPLGLGAKLLFFSQLKSLRSERDVVAVARFSNFKSL